MSITRASLDFILLDYERLSLTLEISLVTIFPRTISNLFYPV